MANAALKIVKETKPVKYYKGKVLLPIPERKKMFLKYMEKTHGMITPAVQKMKLDGLAISEEWIHLYRKKTPKFDEEVKLKQSSLSDFVESKLFERISEGNIQAITFWLRTQNPRYKTQMEVDVKTITTLTKEQKLAIINEIKFK